VTSICSSYTELRVIPNTRTDFIPVESAISPQLLSNSSSNGSLVGCVIDRAGVGGVSITSSSGGVNLKGASTVSTEVVKIGGVGPLGIDGGVVIESTL
jgi:hypothetical protein